jgi:hypothetical protein
MPNWYAEDDDGHVRCYFDDKNGHELSDCDTFHAASYAKWERQRNTKPLPAWLQKVADARVFVPSQAYYDRKESDDPDYDLDDEYRAIFFDKDW